MRYIPSLAIVAALLIATYGCDPDSDINGPITPPDGNIIWVVNYEDNGTVVALNDAGEEYFALDGFTRPRAIDCYARDGSVWILDYYGSCACKYNVSGNEVYKTPTGNGQLLQRPTGLDIFQVNGMVWIANRDDNQVILLNADGTVQAIISGFSFPRDVSIVPDEGNCWVANEAGGNAILIRGDASGSVDYPNVMVAESGDLGSVWDIAAVPAGAAWVCNKNSGTLYGLDANGNTIAELTGFNELTSVYIHPVTNDIYAVDKADGTIVGFPAGTTGTGSYVGFGNFAITGLAGPTNIWIDDVSGKIYVAETDGDTVKIFDNTGALLTTITGLSNPIDLAYWVQ